MNSNNTHSTSFRRLVSLLVVGYSIVPAAWAEREARDRPPNIVLIVSDDQGFNDLGVLNPKLITPNLDRLAREGVRLTNFYVAWPACTPSRGAFLTGRYPQRNGIYDMIRNEAPDYGYRYKSESEYAVTWERIGGMDVNEVLIPEPLGQVGYVSGIFGKWDLGSLRRFLPTQRGFDEFYGFVNTGIDYFVHERYGVPSMYRNNQPTTEDRGTYATDLFRREATQFLEEHAAEPFLLYLPFNAPHSASNLDPRVRGAAQAPQRTKKLYPELASQAGYRHVESYRRYRKPADVPNSALKKLQYRASITAMDAAIGDILDLLDHHQLTDDTLVIFFSDNGGGGSADNGPLRGGKASMFEGGVRVCGLVRFPGHIPPGSVCDQFLTSLELFPTILDVAGAKPPGNVVLDGFNMLPVLSGEQPSARRKMFWQRRSHKAARVDHWKWIETRQEQYLFSLAQDVGETENLVQQQPERAAMMRQQFQSWKKKMDAAEPKRGPFRNF